jgi:hypothetical protein
VAELTKPELLHHEHQHVQGLVLDCLRQVVRVCKLDNYTSDHLLSPSSSTNTSPQVSCDNEVYVACGVCLLKSNARWLRSYLSSCAHTFLCCLLFGQRREQDTSSSPQPPKANTPLEKNRAHGKALAVAGKGVNRKERRRAQPEMEHWLSAPGELATIIKCVQYQCYLCSVIDEEVRTDPARFVHTLSRNKDWSQTPLGPLSQWPLALKIALTVCLWSRYSVVRRNSATGSRALCPPIYSTVVCRVVSCYVAIMCEPSGPFLGTRIQGDLQ